MFSFVQPQGPEIRIQRKLLNKLALFQKRPELFGTGSYTITCGVSPDVVDLFFARVGGDRSESVASEKVEQLRTLCDELGFSGFEDEFRAVVSRGLRIEKDLAPLRSRVDRHDVLLEQLQRRVFELERQLQTQREVQQRVEDVEMRIDQAVAEIRSQDVGNEIQWLKTEIRDRASAADVAALAAEVLCLKEAEAKRTTVPVRPIGQVVQQRAPVPVQPIGHVVQQPAPVPVQQMEVPTGIQILYNASRPLDGVIAFLTRDWYDKHGRYSHPDVVKATASSISWSGSGPEKAVDLEKYNYFCSNGEPSPWICFWFMGKRVAPTSYSIRTSRGSFPKSWVFEVSNDGSRWEIVDSRHDEPFHAEFEIRNFTIGASSPGGFGWIRLRQTDVTHAGDRTLSLAALEVFGTLLTE